MRLLAVLIAVLGTSVPSWAKEDSKGAKPAVRLARDLTKVPLGKYRMTQAWTQKGTEIEEMADGASPLKKVIDSSNRLTFTVEIAAGVGAARTLTVVVRRIEMRVRDTGSDLSFDSDGSADKQTEILHRQFHLLVGKSSKVDAAAFSAGTGFSGLDAVWDQFAKEHPEMSRAAAANHRNYGDARLDRIFERGLDVLFGEEAGRAKGESREVRVGDVFTSSVEKPGIFLKPTKVELACKVVAADSNLVVVGTDWKINGFDPSTEGGALLMRGGDIHATARCSFQPQSGLLVRLEETIERTDQSAPGGRAGVLQWTRKTTEKNDLSITKE